MSAAAIVAAFGLAATPPRADPVSSDGGAALVIQLGPAETIDGIVEPATGTATYALARGKCDRVPSVG
jgi:hypothetical protein